MKSSLLEVFKTRFLSRTLSISPINAYVKIANLTFWYLFQNSTGKTCGSWHRLPRRYRRQLRRDEIHAQLTNQDGVTISGRIGKHYGLSSELFSGLATSTTGHTFTFCFKAHLDRLFRPSILNKNVLFVLKV